MPQFRDPRESVTIIIFQPSNALTWSLKLMFIASNITTFCCSASNLISISQTILYKCTSIFSSAALKWSSVSTSFALSLSSLLKSSWESVNSAFHSSKMALIGRCICFKSIVAMKLICQQQHLLLLLHSVQTVSFLNSMSSLQYHFPSWMHLL